MHAIRRAVMGCLLAACGGAPAISPQITYVTPAPTPAATAESPTPHATRAPSPPTTPAATRTPTLAPSPSPALTGDDASAVRLVEEGFVELDALIVRIRADPGLDGLTEIYFDLRDFTQRQQRESERLDPSLCTLRGLRYWTEAMGLLEQAADSFLAFASGERPDLPFDRSAAWTEAAQKVVLAMNEVRQACP